MIETLWNYRARLVRVIDGDTIVLLVDTGFSTRYEATIRIQGINCPELSSDKGLLARAALISIIGDGCGEWPIRISTQKISSGNESMSFSRYVGMVGVVQDDGSTKDVGESMISLGHAERYIR